MKTIVKVGLPALLGLAVAAQSASAWGWQRCQPCCPDTSSAGPMDFASDPAHYPDAVPAWHWYGWGAARPGHILTSAVPEMAPTPTPAKEPLLPLDTTTLPLQQPAITP